MNIAVCLALLMLLAQFWYVLIEFIDSLEPQANLQREEDIVIKIRAVLSRVNDDDDDL
jgi:hypothetical protein